MTKSDQIIAAVVAENRGDAHAGIPVERLQELTAGQYEWAGANGGLFGSRNPRMESRGNMRFLTDYGRQKLVEYLGGRQN